MPIGKFLCAAGLLLLPTAAPGAAVTVLGHSYARLCYEAAERVAPEEKPAWPSFARAALKHCDRAFAEETLASDDFVATHVNRGILRMKSGDVVGALADYDAAIARDPDEAEAYLNKGVATAKRSDWPEAVRLFTIAIEKRTRRPALAYFGRGLMHENLGDVRSAYYDYKQASSLEPEWALPAQELTRFIVRRP